MSWTISPGAGEDLVLGGGLVLPPVVPLTLLLALLFDADDADDDDDMDVVVELGMAIQFPLG